MDGSQQQDRRGAGWRVHLVGSIAEWVLQAHELSEDEWDVDDLVAARLLEALADPPSRHFT